MVPEYLMIVSWVGYEANTATDGKLTKLVVPPVMRLVTTRFGLFAPVTMNESVELVALIVVMPLASVPAVLVTTSVPLVRVMVLLVLVGPAEMLLASTVPLRIFNTPRVANTAAPAVWVVRPSTKLLFTRKMADPFTLMKPTFGAVLVFGPSAWLPA